MQSGAASELRVARKISQSQHRAQESRHVLFCSLFNFYYSYFNHFNYCIKMATEVVDDHEIREAQRDYLDFLDDDVSSSPH